MDAFTWKKISAIAELCEYIYINWFFMFFCYFCEQLQQLVVENILAFNEGFWIRLAARTDTCKSEDDKAWFLTWLILIFYCVPVVDFLQFPLYNNGFGIISVLLQKDYEELATSVMNIVDRIVHKTHVPCSLLHYQFNNLWFCYAFIHVKYLLIL